MWQHVLLVTHTLLHSNQRKQEPHKPGEAWVSLPLVSSVHFRETFSQTHTVKFNLTLEMKYESQQQVSVGRFQTQ